MSVCGVRSTSKKTEADGYLQVPGMLGWGECQFGEGNNHEDRYGKGGICKDQISSEQP